MPGMPGMTRDQRLNELEIVLTECIQQQDAFKEVADQTQLQFKELSDCTQENVCQLNELFSSLSNEVASLQNSKASLEARLASLELLVEQQQDQIRQLSSAGSSLTREFTAVRVDHLGLKDEHRGLCDCLVEKELMRPMEVRARSRWHRGLGMLREALDDKQVTLRMWRMAGNSVGRLLNASSAFNGLRGGFLALRAEGGLLPGGRAAAGGLGEAEMEKLLRAARSPSEPVWQRIADYAPSGRKLEGWGSSAIVGKAFGSFVIENMPGGCEEMKFAHVHKLLAEVGISTEQLVGKFFYSTPLPRSSSSSHKLQPVADEILARFASASGRKRLRFRDIFSLLELLGLSLERFEKQFAHLADPELAGGQSPPYFGKYRAVQSIGRGSRGVCYLAEDPRERTKVAIKWPVQKEEVSTLRQLQQKPHTGLPRLLGTGEYQEQTYIVTQAFGSPLMKVFLHLEGRSAAKRWAAMSVLGRLMVRRLQSMHSAGLVHCDISPENILLGPPPTCLGSAGARFAPFLVDFGHAQRFPGGPGLTAGEAGSLEWSSIRSADGREPLPEDDLQALGWVLLNGVFGELPWFKMLHGAYQAWDSRFTRDQMVRQAKQAKIQLLTEGWQSFGLTRAKVPEELDKFIRACCPEGSIPELASPSDDKVSSAQSGNHRHGLPDYAALLRLLGGEPDPAAEEQDLRLFSERLMPFL